MKKKLAVLLAMAMTLSMAACHQDSAGSDTSGKGKMEEEISEVSDAGSEEYITWIREAVAEYEKAPVRQVTTTYTNSYEDGSEDEFTTIEMINQEKEIVYSAYEGDDFSSSEFFTKEDGTEYWYTETYVYDEKSEGLETEVCKVSRPDEDVEQWFYEDFVATSMGVPFESDEGTEYRNVVVTNEGEETLNGVKVVRLSVAYESRTPGSEQITREDVIAENGFNEEYIGYLDGMSEALDAYVKEVNELNAKQEEFKAGAAVFYLTADEHKLVRSDKIEDTPVYDTPAMDAYMEFEEKYYTLEDDLNNEYTIKEALQDIAESSGEDEEENEVPGTTGYTSVAEYFVGDDCDPMPELPEISKEMTYEQYMGDEDEEPELDEDGGELDSGMADEKSGE